MAGAVVSVVALQARSAWADPHPLPFNYPYHTLPAGLSEVEQYVDMTPVRAVADANTGSATTTLGSALLTEVEYGITDRLELGFYLAFLSEPGANSPVRFDGLKQRLRYRFAEAGAWPVDLGVYGEVAEFSDAVELEAKIILERRFNRWLVQANPWAERAYHYSGEREWVINPTAGVSFEVTPAFRAGVEYWMRDQLSSNRPTENAFNAAGHHYVGPSFLLQGTRVWLAVAPYIRLDNWKRAGQVGDEFGRFWVRSIVGIEL